MNYKAEVLKRVPSARAYRSQFSIADTRYRIETAKGLPLSDWRLSDTEVWKSTFLKLVEGAMK